MKIIKSLLENYITIPKTISTQKLGDIITKHIAEVEGIIEEEKEFENIVVGEIKEILPHPNADKLKLTKTDVGESELLPIVCGGSNLEIGQKVIVAKLGAKVYWHGDKTPTIMQKAKIRGEVSLGMICASEEVKLDNEFPHEKKEIAELPKDAKTGMPLAEYLNMNDIAFDIDNKSLTHRPDLWGHYGFARDIACVLDIPFKEYKTTESKECANLNIQSHVDDKCLCLSSQKFHTGKPKPSPKWLKQVLALSDVKSINTLVDITNLVMLEFGQPLHAYDHRFLEGDIQVRFAKDGETFTTLNEKEHTLTSEDLLMADSKKAIGLAGIMGGKDSEIKEDTTEIVIEIATFNPVSIRKTATRVGLSTDASKRFEKALDPYLPKLVMSRVRELLENLHAEDYKELSQCSIITHENAKILLNKTIQFNPNKVSEIMGQKIKDQKHILTKLDFDVEEVTDNNWKVKVPSFRATKDVSEECDLIEEICRMKGYEEISPTPFTTEVNLPKLTKEKLFQRQLSNILISLGCFESMSYSFVSESLMQKFGSSTEKLIPLTNTLSKEHTHLRDHLLYTLCSYLDTTFKNTKDVKVFEFGNVFNNENELNEYQTAITLIALPEYKTDPIVFHEAKSMTDIALKKLHIDFSLITESETSSFAHPYRYCEYSSQNKPIVKIYELHPNISQNWKWKKIRIAAIEWNLQNLIQVQNTKLKYQEPEKFPRILKGVSFYLDKKILVNTIQEKVKKSSQLIKDVKIADFYEGENVPDGKKAVALEIQYFNPKKTLEEKDIENIQSQALKIIEKNGGDIREI